MLKIALFSDVHGNYYALQAVLTKIHEVSTKQPVDCIYSLGDVLFGHAGGNDVMELLEQYDVQLIRGNHDEKRIPDGRLTPQKMAMLQSTHDWLDTHVEPDHLTRLDTSPLQKKILLEDGRYLCMFHSNPDDLWDMVNGSDPAGEDLAKVFGNVDAEIIAYGHYHHEHVMSFDRKIMINVASVDSFVRDEQDGMARFTILSSYPDRLVIHSHTVTYDTESQRRMNRRFNVPSFFD